MCRRSSMRRSRRPPLRAKGANLAESLGSQHIQIGGKKIDYAAIVKALVGAVISIIALFPSFTSVSMFGEKISSSLFPQRCRRLVHARHALGDRRMRGPGEAVHRTRADRP